MISQLAGSVRNVLTNIGAILIFIQTVYPGLTGEKIVQAFSDGTWISHAINLCLMYYLYRDGK